MGFDLGRFFQDAGDALGGVASDVAHGVETAVQDVARGVEDVVQDIGAGLEDVVQDIGAGLEDVAGDIAEGFEDAGEWIAGAAEDAGEWILGAAEDVVEVFTVITDGTAAAIDLIDDARGLVPHEEVIGIDVRPGTFWASLGGPTASVPLEPGGDTAIPLALPQLPPNADVKRIRARLTVGLENDPATPETLDVVVSSQTTPAGDDVYAGIQTISSSLTPPPVPTNLRVGLQGGEAFWSKEGPVAPGFYDLPDFAEAASAYLDKARLPAGTEMTLVFLVHSDTPGRVDLEIVAGELEYTVLQTQTWPNPLDGTLRIDRNLTLDFGTVARIPLDTPVPGPADGPLGLAGVRIDVSGTVGAERLLGDVPAHDGREFATVSPDYGVAQVVLLTPATGFPAGASVQVAGVTAILGVDAGGAELYVELRADGGGAPGSDKPLGGVDFDVAPPAGTTGPAWAYAALPEPAAVVVGTPYWIVFRAIRGMARIAAGPPGPGGYLGPMLVNRGGQLWKPFAAGRGPAALLRLAYLPEPDRQTAALALGFEGQPPLRPEVTAESRRLTLPVSGGRAPGAIVVTSHARGATTLANLVQEFTHAGGAG